MRWASEIRGTKLAGFSERSRSFCGNGIHVGFLIAYREVLSSVISAAMDRVYAKLNSAIKGRLAHATERETERGVVVTPEFSRLIDAVTATNVRWQKLLIGDLKT